MLSAAVHGALERLVTSERLSKWFVTAEPRPAPARPQSETLSVVPDRRNGGVKIHVVPCEKRRIIDRAEWPPGGKLGGSLGATLVESGVERIVTSGA
jgi:hypothetical protein